MGIALLTPNGVFHSSMLFPIDQSEVKMKSCTLKLKSCWVKAALALVLTGAMGAASAAPTPPPPDPFLVDLTGGGTDVKVNGALFTTPPNPPINSGTGYWDPFLRIQTSGNNAGSTTKGCGQGSGQTCEQGYNTSDRAFQYDEKNPLNYTHDLTLGEVPIVVVDGVSYFEFLLDIAEPATTSKSLLSLDSLQLFVSETNLDTSTQAGSYSDDFGGNVNVNPGSSSPGKLGGLDAVWSLDGASNNSIMLDYNLVSQGNGRADLVALIPVAPVIAAGLLDGKNSVYLFSRFGDISAPDPAIAEGSFEEWAVRGGTSGGGGGGGGVPEPGTMALFGAAILAGLFNDRRRRQACA